MIASVSKRKTRIQVFTFADKLCSPSRKINKLQDIEANINDTPQVLKKMSACGKVYNNIFRIFY